VISLFHVVSIKKVVEQKLIVVLQCPAPITDAVKQEHIIALASVVGIQSMAAQISQEIVASKNVINQMLLVDVKAKYTPSPARHLP